jgi:hypothetical protein
MAVNTKTTSYDQACDAYMKWAKAQPGVPQQPNEGLSKEYDGLWHLENIHGPLAAVTAKGEIVPVGEFFEAYERLAKEGKCDCAGGMEYRRVLREWIENKPDDLDEFIVRRANVGPNGEISPTVDVLHAGLEDFDEPNYAAIVIKSSRDEVEGNTLAEVADAFGMGLSNDENEFVQCDDGRLYQIGAKVVVTEIDADQGPYEGWPNDEPDEEQTSH